MPLRDLPDEALAAVVDAVPREDRAALRTACRSTRRAANLRTSQVSAALRVHAPLVCVTLPCLLRVLASL